MKNIIGKAGVLKYASKNCQIKPSTEQNSHLPLSRQSTKGCALSNNCLVVTELNQMWDTHLGILI